ncbi:MAG TPA: sigma-54-dependent Fis family transcriptional regulator, partial [Deltaproteobacteria bacterium]|nr:sigma-54-dependent Fis family transcriptional regulator [Deltaproteobacteria bacterium]
ILNLRKDPKPPKLSNPKPFAKIITESNEMLKLLREAELHAQSDVPILITGESGTGKELLARAIHNASPRKESPFTPLNMASFSETLFDAEFFGHTKGAFTGAEKDRRGYLEYTDGGTLFLDEIGILPFELQGKLLRVLQDGEFIKLGSNKNKRVNIRFIAATNENLSEKTAQGKFRKDLYYRLNGAWLHIPPLRERKEDIPLLTNKFLREYTLKGKSSSISKEAMDVLLSHNYPGNVRELKSIIQFSVNLAQGETIKIYHLPKYVQKVKPKKHKVSKGRQTEDLPLDEVVKNHILKVYENTGRNKTKTASVLGIGLNTLRRKLSLYGVS